MDESPRLSFPRPSAKPRFLSTPCTSTLQLSIVKPSTADDSGKGVVEMYKTIMAPGVCLQPHTKAHKTTRNTDLFLFHLAGQSLLRIHKLNSALFPTISCNLSLCLCLFNSPQL